MTDALVGFTGFVGSNLRMQHQFDAQYNSRNIQDIAGEHFETLVFAGARAEKWKANADPDADRVGIEKAIDCVKRTTINRLVLISTIDVLPPTSGLDEDFDCSTASTHAYGANRFHLEQALSDAFENIHIVRLPGLFGPGLKKNIIFDFLNNNMLEKINPASAYQFYDLTRLWSDIERIIKLDIPLIHLFPEPIQTQEIIDGLFPNAVAGADPAPEARYDYKTKYDDLFGGARGYLYDAVEVLDRLRSFVETQRS